VVKGTFGFLDIGVLKRAWFDSGRKEPPGSWIL
jgi:hypothetical protein